jgi:tetratricopeptide (TPR) repeat protein
MKGNSWKWRMLAAALILGLALSGTALAQEKGKPGEPECQENLRALGDALKLYLMNNEGKLPSRLSELYKQGFVPDLATFSCPASGKRITEEAQIDQLTDYEVVDQAGGDPKRRPIIKEKYGYHDGMALVFNTDFSIDKVKAPAPPVSSDVAKVPEPKPNEPVKPPDAPKDQPLPPVGPLEPPKPSEITPKTEPAPKTTPGVKTPSPQPRPGEEPPKVEKTPETPAPSLPSTQPEARLADPPELAAGVSQLKSGNYALALQLFELALKRVPENPRFIMYRGTGRLWMDDLQGALADFRTAADKNKDKESRRLRAALELVAGDPKAGLAEAKALLNEFPQDSGILILFGQASLYNGYLMDAKPNFEKARQLSPGTANALFWEGNRFLEAGVPAVARMQYLTVLHLDSTMVGTYYGLGLACARLGAKEDALQYFQEYLRADPVSPNAQGARQAMARLRETRAPETKTAATVKSKSSLTAQDYVKKAMEAKELEQKISYLTMAIKLEPKNAEAYAKRGYQYTRGKDYEKAVSDFNRAIKLNPKLTIGYGYRGIMYYGKKENDKALNDFNKAIELDPKLAALYRYRGDIYYRKKSYDKAISNYNTAIELAPTYALAYFSRGNSYILKYDYNKALSDFNKAISLQNNYADAYFSRAITYFKIGDQEKARRDYDKAKALNPKLPTLNIPKNGPPNASRK